jgi:hypothetical protein
VHCAFRAKEVPLQPCLHGNTQLQQLCGLHPCLLSPAAATSTKICCAEARCPAYGPTLSACTYRKDAYVPDAMWP